jgi:hypothetical protein
MASHVNDLYDEVELGTLRGWYSNTETLSGQKDLVDADLPIQYLDPGGSARDVILPVEAVANHSFWIINRADAAETITVKTVGDVTIGTVAQNENKQFVSNGVAWELMTTGGGAATQITETSGPTTLNIGAIADGEYLKRSGTDIVGAAVSGGSGAVTNDLINGGFDIWQRGGISSAVAMTDNTFNGPDMWFSLVQGANPTIERVAGGYGTQYGLKMVMGGTTNRGGIGQVVEAVKSIPRRGKTEIFQYMVKAVKDAGSGSIDMRIALLEWTGTADEITVDLIQDWTSSDYTVGASKFFANSTLTLVGTAQVSAAHNTWTQVSVSGAVSASCNNLIALIWTEDVPAHASDYVIISEAGIYKAATAQDWNPPDPDDERKRCLRFCEVYDDANSDAGIELAFGMVVTTSSIHVKLNYSWKRKSPTVVIPDISKWGIGSAVAFTAATSYTPSDFGPTTCLIVAGTSASHTIGQGARIRTMGGQTNSLCIITAEIYVVA